MKGLNKKIPPPLFSYNQILRKLVLLILLIGETKITELKGVGQNHALRILEKLKVQLKPNRINLFLLIPIFLS